MCFPGGSEVKNLPVNAGYRFDPWAGTIPWRREWHPTPVFSPGKSHGQRCLMGYSPWGLKRVQHDLLTKTNQAMYQVLYLSGYLLWINPNSEPLTPRSISLFPVFIGTKLATQLTFKEGIRLEKVLWGRESQRKGVLSEGSWRSKAWEARSGHGVSGTATGRPRAHHTWGGSHLRNPPQLEENQMVPACPHKDSETARGFGQDVCKILRSYSYLTEKQKPFKNITPQSCECNWDSPKSFPHPLSPLAITCSVALWSCLVPALGFFLKRPGPEKCCLIFSGLHQALKTVWSSNSFSDTTSFTNHSWNNYKRSSSFAPIQIQRHKLYFLVLQSHMQKKGHNSAVRITYKCQQLFLKSIIK